MGFCTKAIVVLGSFAEVDWDFANRAGNCFPCQAATKHTHMVSPRFYIYTNININHHKKSLRIIINILEISSMDTILGSILVLFSFLSPLIGRLCEVVSESKACCSLQFLFLFY